MELLLLLILERKLHHLFPIILFIKCHEFCILYKFLTVSGIKGGALLHHLGVSLGSIFGDESCDAIIGYVFIVFSVLVWLFVFVIIGLV